MAEETHMPEERRMSRLVARYFLDPPMAIEWDTAHKNKHLPGRASPVEAEIRDLSLAGALIAIESKTHPTVDSIVEFKRGGNPAYVRVRHTRTSESASRALVGVEFLDVVDALPDLYDIIGELRDASHRLEQLWDSAD